LLDSCLFLSHAKHINTLHDKMWGSLILQKVVSIFTTES